MDYPQKVQNGADDKDQYLSFGGHVVLHQPNSDIFNKRFQESSIEDSTGIISTKNSK